jgi:hypothetical protein
MNNNYTDDLKKFTLNCLASHNTYLIVACTFVCSIHISAGNHVKKTATPEFAFSHHAGWYCLLQQRVGHDIHDNSAESTRQKQR